MRLDNERRNRRRRWVTALAVLLTTTFLAGPALADHRRYRHSDWRHGYQGHHERGHHWRQVRHSYRHQRGYPVYVHGSQRYAHHEAGYYCGPCSHRFGSYAALSHHVHDRHHVPLWKLPFVIVDSIVGGALRWIFHG